MRTSRLQGKGVSPRPKGTLCRHCTSVVRVMSDMQLCEQTGSLQMLHTECIEPLLKRHTCMNEQYLGDVVTSAALVSRADRSRLQQARR